MKLAGTLLMTPAVFSSVHGLITKDTGSDAGVSPPQRPAIGWQPVPASKVPYVPVTYPKHGEVWLAATHHNVTWDTTEVPKDREFTKTAIFLAKEGEVISDEPLASNFSLHDGRVPIQTPTEASGDDFQVILFAEHGSDDDPGSYSADYAIIQLTDESPDELPDELPDLPQSQ